MLLHNIELNIQNLINNFSSVSNERQKLLKEFATYISNKLLADKSVKLTFICTHNSRRSHMSQIAAQVAAEYYNIDGVECYSGGTEATAFYKSAVEAIINFGLEVEKKDEKNNPIYLVNYATDKSPIKCFSKVYNDPFNPQKGYAAVMTCSHADENCPIVFGADKRFPIRYNDPKEFDGTDIEHQKYEERFNQILTEMLFAFSLVKIKKD